MRAALGIDTGGTYTDAVLVEQTSGTVLASAKALTTYADLSVGIGQAVSAVLQQQALPPDQVELIALSTTLATNAIVEERGSPVCLMLIGYDPLLIQQYGFDRELVTQDVVYLAGGHDGDGNEAAPLDEAAAREAILARRGKVEAFAVSGYFSVRNPSHELRVRALIEELSGLPVTCGHELTSRLNAVRRATTAALNARLIPLLRDLISTVRGTLDGLGITTPLMLVRGDGSLVRAEWAMRRPVETILSGPAASVLGAWHLAGRRDAWVVDIGGTTTDIAVLRDGRPRLNPDGAQVGRWRTMVEAVDVHTVGLGGDSLVSLDKEGRLTVGPRRVIPLCVLASEHPEIVAELRQSMQSLHRLSGQFVVAQRQAAPWLSDDDRELLHELNGKPCPLRLLDQRGYGMLVLRRVEALEAHRIVLRSGFTPTDALHALGRFERWNAEASRLGALLLARQLDLTPEALCEQVVRRVSERVASELVTKVLSDEGASPDWTHDRAAAALLERALVHMPASDLGCSLTLRQPVVAVGAPAEVYAPPAARLLNTDPLVTPHADVANAVGAAVGAVVQQAQVTIRPLDSGQMFRLYLPDGVQDFSSLEEGVGYARQIMLPYLQALAQEAGTEQVEVQVTRTDQIVSLPLGWGQDIYLGTELVFTAVGRPSPASRP
jgi:N-methylhydantoinase A/oxoprolinase/acetone carboxylase beta subunit